jgi:excisionase family DNA binding protein
VVADQQWMSVEEVARALDLQPRTVRNYIRDGRLPAVRIGKQYRIAAADFAAMTGAVPANPIQPAGVTRGTDPERALASDATSVIWLSGLAARDLDRLTTLFTAAGASPGADVRVVQFPEERRLKVLVIGPVGPVASFLAYVQAILDTGL